MPEYLGTVRNISAGRKTLDLHVFDDGIIVGKGDLKGMALRVAGGTAFGATGLKAADDLATRSESASARSVASSGRDELLASDAANRFIPLDAIKAIRLSHPRFPPIYRIDLDMVDGRTERFEWKRLHNEPRDVANLFSTAAGDRVTAAGH